MFGSRSEPELMDGRHIVWSSPSMGVPLQDVLLHLTELVAKHGTDLMFGYWEYGDEIVVTAPEVRVSQENADAQDKPGS